MYKKKIPSEPAVKPVMKGNIRTGISATFKGVTCNSYRIKKQPRKENCHEKGGKTERITELFSLLLSTLSHRKVRHNLHE